jgi:hypothetical protein
MNALSFGMHSLFVFMEIYISTGDEDVRYHLEEIQARAGHMEVAPQMDEPVGLIQSLLSSRGSYSLFCLLSLVIHQICTHYRCVNSRIPCLSCPDGLKIGSTMTTMTS